MSEKIEVVRSEDITIENGTQEDSEQGAKNEASEEPRLTEFQKAMQRSAESAARLGMDQEGFTELSLRSKYALSILDLANSDVEAIQSASETDSIVFAANGAKIGDMQIPYSSEIQEAIDVNFLNTKIHDRDFSAMLLENNDKLRKSLADNIKSPVSSDANSFFRTFTKSPYIDEFKLAETPEETIRAVIEAKSAERALKSSSAIEDFVQITGVELPKEFTPEQHAYNVKNAKKIEGYEKTKVKYEKAKEKLYKLEEPARAINGIYSCLSNEYKSPTFSNYKKVRRHPYDLRFTYLLSPINPLQQRGDVFYNARATYSLNVYEACDQKQPTITEAVDMIRVFCEKREGLSLTGLEKLDIKALSGMEPYDSSDRRAISTVEKMDLELRLEKNIQERIGKNLQDDAAESTELGGADFDNPDINNISEALGINPNSKALRSFRKAVSLLEGDGGDESARSSITTKSEASEETKSYISKTLERTIEHVEKLKEREKNEIEARKTVEEFICSNPDALHAFAVAARRQFDVDQEKIKSYLENATKIGSDVYNRKTPIEEITTSNPAFMALANSLVKSVRLNDAVNVIYGYAPLDFIIRAKSEEDDRTEADAIVRNAKIILSMAKKKGVPIPGITEESFLYDEVSRALKKSGLVEEPITQDNVKEIAQKHHRVFENLLTDYIVKALDYKQVKEQYQTQKITYQLLVERFKKAGLANANSNNPEVISFTPEQEAYLTNATALGDFRDGISNLVTFSKMLRLNTEGSRGSEREYDAIKESLGLKTYGEYVDGYDYTASELRERIEGAKATIRDALTRVFQNHGKNPGDSIDRLLDGYTKILEDSSNASISIVRDCLIDNPSLDNDMNSMGQAERFQSVYSTKDAIMRARAANEAWSERFANAALPERLRELARQLGYTGNISEVTDALFMPGFMILFDENGMSDIAKTKIPTLQEATQTSSEGVLGVAKDFFKKAPFVTSDQDAIARSYLDKYILQQTFQNEVVGSNKLEQRIIALEDKYEISTEKHAINPDGSLNEILPKPEVKALEMIAPYFGGFIKRAFSTRYRRPANASIVKTMANNQRAFICGEISKPLVVIAAEADYGVSTTILAELMRSKDVNAARQLELIANDIALLDYSNLSAEEINLFAQAAKVVPNQSVIAVLYQKVFTNRNALTQATYKHAYCKEFAKYCASGGKATGPLKDFFDRRSRIIKGKEKRK